MLDEETKSLLLEYAATEIEKKSRSKEQAARKNLQTAQKIQNAAIRDVLSFIGHFTYDAEQNKEREQVIKTFTQGCCYWFAHILAERFKDQYGASIVYDDIAGHFGACICGEIYDITGHVTEKYAWKPWSGWQDELQKSRIIEQCINF